MTQSRSEQTQVIPKRNTLQMRLVLFMLLIALVPLTFTSSRNIIETREALIKGAEISLQSGALQTANSLDGFINETLNSVQIESQFSDFATFLAMAPAERA